MEFLNQADKLETYGPTGAGAVRSEKEALNEWGQFAGYDPNDPATFDKVYEAVAAMHKNEVESAAKAARARQEALNKARRKSGKSGRIR